MTPHEYSHRAARETQCAAWEPVLTALFDEEADADEARLARAHLASCARCTQLWNGWNDARAFLKSVSPHSRAAAAPLSLSARIRLACSAMPEPIAESPEYSAAARIQSERLLEETLWEAARGREPQPFTPVLEPFFAPVTVPPELQRSILRATVGAMRIEKSTARKSTPALISWREVLRSWLAPAPLRVAGALAVAALVFVAARSPQNWVETQNIISPKKLQTSHSIPTLRIAASTPRAPMTFFNLNQIAFGTAQAATLQPVPNAAAPRVLQAVLPAKSALEIRAPQHAMLEVRASTPRHAPLRNAVWTNDSTSPRAIAETSAATRGATRIVVHLVNYTRRATSPTSAPRALEANFDETLDAVSRLRDERPEAVSAVVDSYRASLVGDERSESAPSADGDDTADDDML